MTGTPRGRPRRSVWRSLLVEMSMTLNGEVMSTGTGAACLGHPLNAVLWLAQPSGRLGDPLQAGELVLSGTPARSSPSPPATRSAQ
jgi:2-keto-4-pentenoate hydratase